MNKSSIARWIALPVFFSMAVTAPIASAEAAELNLVPWPQSVHLAQGSLPLSAQNRIICSQAALEPLARVLAEEIKCISGLELPVERPQQINRGDIILTINSSLKKEAYRLEIAREATVRGGNYGAVALGTATLLPGPGRQRADGRPSQNVD